MSGDSTPTHAELCARGERWLRSNGCRVVLRDPFKAAVYTGECPDVIGWRDGHSVLIECKTSRADYLADKAKKFRADPSLGMGDVRLYMAPPGVIKVEDLPDGWGLLIAHPKRIEIAGPHPRTYVCTFWGEARKRVDFRPLPFDGNKQCENVMLVSALARIKPADAALTDQGRAGRVVVMHPHDFNKALLESNWFNALSAHPAAEQRKQECIGHEWKLKSTFSGVQIMACKNCGLERP